MWSLNGKEGLKCLRRNLFPEAVEHVAQDTVVVILIITKMTVFRRCPFLHNARFFVGRQRCHPKSMCPRIHGAATRSGTGRAFEPILKSLLPYRLMCPQALPVRFWGYRSDPISWPFPSGEAPTTEKPPKQDPLQGPFSRLANHFRSTASFLRGLQQEGTHPPVSVVIRCE